LKKKSYLCAVINQKKNRNKMKKVFLALAVVAFAAFAVACGNAPQQGGEATATEVRAACCAEGPSCCREGLTREECDRRKAKAAGQCCTQ